MMEAAVDQAKSFEENLKRLEDDFVLTFGMLAVLEMKIESSALLMVELEA
jgi:hypothetical protein